MRGDGGVVLLDAALGGAVEREVQLPEDVVLVARRVRLGALAERPAAAVARVVVVRRKAAGGTDVHVDGAVVLEAPLGDVLVPADLVDRVDEEVLALGLEDLVGAVALHAEGVAA